MEGTADHDRSVGSVAEARTPDLAEEIVGWKVLAVGGEGHLHHHLDQMHEVVIPSVLSSPLRETLWPTRGWLNATCTRDPEHLPPDEGCSCGIYAVADSGRAKAYLRDAPLTVLARVGLAGKVIPGTHGWRAERARIVALTRVGVGFNDYPGLFARVARRYDVPVLDPHL